VPFPFRDSDRRPFRRRSTPRPSTFEALEPRLALAVGQSHGAWSIDGDSDPGQPNDTIRVDRNPANPAELRAVVNGFVIGTRLEADIEAIRIAGGRGDDTISVSIPGNTRITASLFGDSGNDIITGGDGDDTIFGGGGNDTMNGGPGADTLRGGRGNDSLVGGRGHDALRGEAGHDTLRGGAGRDSLDGGAGRDRFFGRQGHDAVTRSAGEEIVANESTNPLGLLDSLDRLKTWYVDTALARWGSLLGNPVRPWGPWVVDPMTVPDGSMTVTSVSRDDFSGTNNQVVGVDEGDIVKTDGRHLFVLAGDGVDILTAGPADGPQVVSHVSTAGTERFLFLSGTWLTVISQGNAPAQPTGTSSLSDRRSSMPAFDWQPSVDVTVIDVADPARPKVREATSLDGWLVDARTIDGRVLVATQNNVDLPAPGIREDGSSVPVPLDPNLILTQATAAEAALGSLPILVGCWPTPGGETRYVYEDEAAYRSRLERAWDDHTLPTFRVTATDVTTVGEMVTVGHAYVPVVSHDGSLLSVSSFDVTDERAGPDATTSVFGLSGSVSASKSNLYVSAVQSGNWWDASDSSMTTNIYRFSLTDLDVRLTAMGAVPGTTLNQFSIDEDEHGLLRVATTTGFGDAASSGVYVLAASASNLHVIGSVAGLAAGERIYSVRFVGRQAYVSTFRQVDPLFVIDLGDPLRPRVVGELKVPGFSTYLHPLDATHLLGIGRDVDSETGRVRGLQLSIFDVSDPAVPRRAATYTFDGDDWESWSPALWDHHAIAWFPARGILALPVHQGDESGLTSSLLVLKVEWLAAAGFVVLGEIRHEQAIERSIRIGDRLYSVSSGEVQVHRLTRPTEQLAAVKLTDPVDPWAGEVWISAARSAT
jgi:uncharacterized secreted protein with C-terminal beta-propeller domain